MSSIEPELVPVTVPKNRYGKKGIARAICQMKLDQPKASNAAIARHFKCSTTNVRKVLDKFKARYSAEELENYKTNRADIFAGIGMKMLASITDNKLAKTSAVQLVTGAAILYDKERLERGQATGINVTALLDVAKLIREQEQ